MNKTWVAALSAAVVGVLKVSVIAAPFTVGDLAVTRLGGDANNNAGASALSSVATSEFIDEYTPAGVYVQTIAIPTTVNGGNLALTDSGTATSDGTLTRSVDGHYLTVAGYNAAPGTTSVTGTASASTARVIAVIGANGSVDTTTGLTDAYSANNIRSVISTDGAHFYTGGTASGTGGGVRYVNGLGSTTSTFLSSTVTNTRVVNIDSNQLYVSSASGAFQGVSTVGTGLPTTSGQTIALLPGFPTATGPSSYDYFFADANTLYVADDRSVGTLATPGAGGLQKWVLVSGTWTLEYTYGVAAGLSSSGLRGLTGLVSNGVATLYATAADQNSTTTGEQTSLISINDTVANTVAPASVFTTIATAPGNTVYRGVDFVPTASSVPEPTNLAAVGVATFTLLARKRKAQ